MVATVLALAPGRARSTPVELRGTDPPFTLALPEGFSPVPETQPGTWVFERRGASGDPVVVTVRALRSTIANVPFDEREVREAFARIAPGAQVSVEHGRTMGLDVPVLVARESSGAVSATAQLPSSPRAVQLTVTGVREDAGTVRDVARASIASFHARTNWLTREEVARKHAARWVLGVAWVMLLAYGVAWFARFRHARRARLEGAWVASAGGVFLAGAALLASVPAGASAFEPVTPALVGLVLLANGMALLRRGGR